MKKKIAIAIALALAGFVGATTVYIIGCEATLMERFPDIHPDDVKAASRKMLIMALKGEFEHIDTEDEELMDTIFLSIVNNG